MKRDILFKVLSSNDYDCRWDNEFKEVFYLDSLESLEGYLACEGLELVGFTEQVFKGIHKMILKNRTGDIYWKFYRHEDLEKLKKGN